MTYSFIFMEFSAFRIHSLRFFSDQKLNYAGEYGKRNEEWNERLRDGEWNWLCVVYAWEREKGREQN